MHAALLVDIHDLEIGAVAAIFRRE